ncbi:helix-turn-helix domain-containing protein [Mycolicibacterium sp. Y3]
MNFSTRRVVILGYSSAQALDVIGPLEVLHFATRQIAGDGAEGGYRAELKSLDGSCISTWGGLKLTTEIAPSPDSSIDTVLIPGGVGAPDESHRGLVGWIRDAASHARRMVGIGTGAFLLAEAGLLDGCPATTHWASADAMRRKFPQIAVDSTPMSVRSSRQVWTAGGATAGIDLALRLVEDDFCTEIAREVARWLVLPLRRRGGQPQYAPALSFPHSARESICRVQEFVESEPAAAHSIAELAKRAGMSPRHFTRVFTHEVGMAPGAYVELVRTNIARRELTETTDGLVIIAARCGFGSTESLRRIFLKRVGVSPDHYRKSFV